MDKKNIVPIVFAFDNNLVFPACVCLSSLMMSAKETTFYDIFILYPASDEFDRKDIDNSPNSLCEAQILGCACVATNVGGVSSLIMEGVTGYLVPANDPYQMAFVLNELPSNSEKNLLIGTAAREVALKRHDKKDIVDRVFEIYNEVLTTSRKKKQ